jgi:hypothetical protein
MESVDGKVQFERVSGFSKSGGIIMFKIFSITGAAALSMFVTTQIAHAQAAADAVTKLVCHELVNSAWLDNHKKGDLLADVIHFVSIDLKAKQATIDNNPKFKITTFDANFYLIESDTAPASDSQSITIDRRDGTLSILNMTVQNGTTVVPTSQTYGVCGTQQTKF